MIRQIPKGKVAAYGAVAAAAGYPLYHRQVVQVLRKAGGSVPWQRVVGAGGAIRTMHDHGLDQRLRLEQEGVTFRGKNVRMDLHRHEFEY